ncbi:hypothetical protein [Roseomonas sp. WA12]
MNRLGLLIGLGLVTLLGWAPFLSVLFTSAVAGALDCRVDESSIHPCPGPFGTDLGELLYTTGIMGWFMLVTWPIVIGTTIAWVVILLRWIWQRIRRPRG